IVWYNATRNPQTSFFFHFRFVGFRELLLHLRRHRIVVAELDRVAALAAGHRLQLGLVIGDFRQWYLRLDDDFAAAQRVGAADARALAGEAAGDVAHVRIRHEYFQIDDRLEHLRFGLGDRFDERLLAGADEGDFLGIDRVVLA